MIRSLTLASMAALIAGGALAQSRPPAPEAPLSPAPRLGTGKDQEGRPIPFGVPPYFSPETPGGTGPFPAIMVAEPTAPQHIVYRPVDMNAAGKIPVLAWGNGGCVHAGNRFRSFLTEIASQGILVISAGTMGHVALEVGPQENPIVVQPGQPVPPPAPPAPPIPNDRTAEWRAMRSTSDHLIQAIDWAVAENAREGSPYFGRLDVEHIGVAGQSCGGGLATVAAADPRVDTLGIFNSGTRLTPRPQDSGDPADIRRQGAARLDPIHSPTIILTGDQILDSAFHGGRETFGYLSDVPVFYAWQDDLGHIATYGAPNGGSAGRIASAWFRWQLKGDQQAGRMFTGADCTLCVEPTWHVQRKGIQ